MFLIATKTMDPKAWLWRKKSSEKTILAIGKADSRVRIEQVIYFLLSN